ncbi:MAG: imidazole glycerol phosphate synthase subunit HisH [Verrucomicrobiales bacterium]
MVLLLNENMNLGIVDYNAGNLQSVRNAFESLGVSPAWVRAPGDLDGLDVLVLPGQGEFGDSAANLKARELWEPIRQWLRDCRPYFGICLGYQLLFEGSEESPDTPGFGIFPGRVVRFPDSPGLKIPHMGWNSLQLADPGDPLWKGLAATGGDNANGDESLPHAYFVHSYYPAPDDESLVASRTDYTLPFASSVRRGSVVATQFHPEKSQQVGLSILRNFLDEMEP